MIFKKVQTQRKIIIFTLFKKNACTGSMKVRVYSATYHKKKLCVKIVFLVT
jgi:hypothetical protein